LPTLQEAVWQERSLHLTYRRSDDTAVERLVDPLGLVVKGSVWYLVAAVEGEMRTYRVSRVQSAKLADRRCVRPRGFDLTAYWKQSSAEFKANLPRYEATVRVAPTLVSRIRSAWRYASIEQAEPPDADGWIRLSMNFEVEDQACEYILGFGPHIEVLEPQELREKVIDLAQRIVVFYAQRPYPSDEPSRS
jgi:predicted DNA-binding transcriptional regulator YafY